MKVLQIVVGIVVFSTLVSFGIVHITEKDGRYILPAVVTNTGSCGGGEGFFSGNYECAVEAKSDNGLIYTNVYGQVVVGQTIYKHCWVEESGNRCYSTASKSIRKGWLE